MAKSKIPSENWVQFDAESLPPKLRKAYDAFKAASKAAGDARAAFNAAFVKELGAKGKVPDGQFVVVGHNFGKLSYALTDEEPRESGKARTDSF